MAAASNPTSAPSMAAASNALGARSSSSSAATHGGTPATAMSIALHGVPLDSTAGGASVRWKPFAIGGAVFVLVVILIGATRGGSPSSPKTGATMARPDPAGPTAPPPDEPITIASPPMESGKAAKDWRKIIDHVERGKFGEARKKLGDWERKYGATPETESLRAQLENRADLDEDHDPHDD
jgi:hypothetical protein